MNQSEDKLISESPALPPRIRVREKALAESLCHHLALDQQVLLRLFGRSVSGEVADDQLVELLRSFSLELPQRKQIVVNGIARRMELGESFLDALGSYNSRLRGRATNFQMMEQALRTAHEQDSLPAFLREVSQYRPSQRPLALQHQDSLRKKLTRLAIKTFVIFQISVLLILYLIPEFLIMSREFGMELPWAMQLLIQVSEVFAQFGLFLIPIACLIAIYFLFKFSSSITSFFAKFSPWNWLKPPLSKHRRRQLLFAISDGQTTVGQADGIKEKQLKFRRNETAALKIVHSADAKSWLLNCIAQQDDQRGLVWKNRLGDAFILFWNLFLACVVAIIAFGTISFLIAIVRGLSGS